MNTACDAMYREAFAYWSPIMRKRWSSNTSASARAYAKTDVLTTLALHNNTSADLAYVAKLYAELDAIRDAEREATKVARRRG